MDRDITVIMNNKKIKKIRPYYFWHILVFVHVKLSISKKIRNMKWILVTIVFMKYRMKEKFILIYDLYGVYYDRTII